MPAMFLGMGTSETQKHIMVEEYMQGEQISEVRYEHVSFELSLADIYEDVDW